MTTDNPAQPGTPERVYKVRDVADHLGTHEDMVTRLIREGRLRAIKLGRAYRIPESALAEFIATGTQP